MESWKPNEQKASNNIVSTPSPKRHSVHAAQRSRPRSLGIAPNGSPSSPIVDTDSASWSNDEGSVVKDDGLASQSSRPYVFFKRCFDLVVGLVLFIIAVPIICVAALAIRLESRGSPIFIQTRLGLKGRPFKLVKLRGMYIDSRIRFASYYDYSTKPNLDFWFHHEVDPRVTKVGAFLRRTSIDELPNLWNVVTGDMSLVGPRPEIPEVLALYGQYRDQYLSVKPGVTCISKCTGRDRLTKRETIELDLGYVRTRSFRTDLRILWRTFRGVVLRRDVY